MLRMARSISAGVAQWLVMRRDVDMTGVELRAVVVEPAILAGQCGPFFRRAGHCQGSLFHLAWKLA
jgi:hypothetical protein